MPPSTPQDWLQYLEPKLDDQLERIQEPDAYYDGRQRLQFATQKFREAFARYYAPLANNWCRLVVDAPVSRMEIQGFRFDPDRAAQTWELDADADAWKIWQSNNFDAVSRIVHTDACKLGMSYVLVAPPDEEDIYNPWPIMTGEHPSQCFTFSDPANANRRLAGIKRWADDFDNHAYATVYLPDSVSHFRSERPLRTPSAGQQAEVVIYDQAGRAIPSTLSKVQWQPIGQDPNSIGVVPLVAIYNNPDLLEGGHSDLDTAIPIQDAVNKLCLDMQVSSEFHAYPQRWATGWERAVDDTGRELSSREVEMYLSATRMIRAESHETAFGTFTQGDVNNYILPIELYIDHLAATSQTPAYYLKGKMANLSADALHAADQGLVDRVKGKIVAYSDPWEEIMRTAFLAKGDLTRGHAQSAEVIWADPESKSLAVLVQAAVQMRQALSVPIEMAWEMLGWSPQKIRQARDLMGLPPGGPAGAATGAAAPAGGPTGLLGPSGQPVSSAGFASQQNNAEPRTGAAPAPAQMFPPATLKTPASQIF
jgi:hypothetical protein